jgi:AP-1 complex subunit mu
MNPLIKTEECTFAFIKHTNLYVVATTRKNSNIAMLFALLHKICQVKLNSSGRLTFVCILV